MVLVWNILRWNCSPPRRTSLRKVEKFTQQLILFYALILLKYTIIAILIIFISILEVCLIGYPNQLHMVITQEVGETMLKLTKTKYLQEQKWFNLDRKNHPFPCFKNSSLMLSSALCTRSINKFSAFILHKISVTFNS